MWGGVGGIIPPSSRARTHTQTQEDVPSGIRPGETAAPQRGLRSTLHRLTPGQVEGEQEEDEGEEEEEEAQAASLRKALSN